jgi:hypothetical protein
METLAFVGERNAALRSLDRNKIEAYARKYGINLPKDEIVFWAGIHKARLQITSFTEEEREVSRRWLKEHGFRESMFAA